MLTIVSCWGRSPLTVGSNNMRGLTAEFPSACINGFWERIADNKVEPVRGRPLKQTNCWKDMVVVVGVCIVVIIGCYNDIMKRLYTKI